MKAILAWWNSLHDATKLDIAAVVIFAITLALSIVFGVLTPRQMGGV